MSFFSEEVESQCRIRSTRGGEGGRAEKENNGGGGGTRFRSHIGSDTSNPEATLQIPPSCWTSCSLHNRIRMNRPSPAPVLLFTIFLLHFASLFILSSRAFRACIPFFLLPFPTSRFFHDALLSLSCFLFSLFRLQIYPTTLSLLPRDVLLAQRMPLDSSFFLVAETLRHRPRTKPPLCSFLPLSSFTTLH